jgi:sulfate adenylyltransferase large subunit
MLTEPTRSREIDRAASVNLLRFSTAGSVDDGKSTLIGRLLFDSKQIFEDQLEALRRSSDLTGGGEINLANLTDGLRAEREQGITIDVAYHYFTTLKRKFIVADTPGHIQYTRNMVTGASTAHAALVLVDARHGVTEQTRRHTFINSLLRVPNLIVCINKMDLVNYSSDNFEMIRKEIATFLDKLSFSSTTFIPISALRGDNVVERSSQMQWYPGPSLIEFLEQIEIGDPNQGEARYPVQYVIRPKSPGSNKDHDFRGLAGQIASGIFKVNDKIVALPSGKASKIKQIYTVDGDLEEARAPMSVNFLLEDNLDIGRGDILVHPDHIPIVSSSFDTMVCWMADQPMQVGQKYVLKHTSRTSRCLISAIDYQIDMKTLEPRSGATTLNSNDIGRVQIRTMKPLVFDPYTINRTTGGLILIDETTNVTVGAAMICGA